MQQRKAWRILLGFLLTLAVPTESPAGRRQTQMIEASAHNPYSAFFGKSEYADRAQINIEKGYAYVSHSVLIVSANPEEEHKGRWSLIDGLIQDEDGRVQTVWLEVRAGNKGFLEDTVCIRARLMVTVEKDN